MTRQLGRDRHGLGVHDVGDRDALQAGGDRALHHGGARGLRRASSRARRATGRRMSRAGQREVERRSRSAARRSPGRAWRRSLVALRRSPVSFQAAARAIRPPSSGNAGTRLNTSSSAFIDTRKDTSSCGDVRGAAPSSRGGVQNASGPASAIPTQRAHDHDRERHQRAGDRDPELLARRVGVAAHLHHAAEEEEVDARHLDAHAPRGQRVAELVQHDRAEEQRRRGHGGDVALRVVPQDVAERLRTARR